jgi:hypothetical protein
MKTSNNNSASNNELEFAYKVRRALDERIADLPEDTVNRLGAARRVALARKKTGATVFVTESAPRFAGIVPEGFSNPFDGSLNWLGRVSIMIPVVILLIGSIGIYQYEQERRADDLAELDAAVLADELPIDAYLDHGFDTFLNKHGE